MSRNLSSSEGAVSQKTAEKNPAPANHPPEVANLLAKAEHLLQAGETRQALDLIARARLNSPWATNALGVCQLRFDNVQLAVDVFRGLVLGAGSVYLRTDVPAVFKTNFAAALLQSNNVRGCLNVLAEVGAEQHPAVGRLRAAIDRWKRSLPLVQKLNWYLGGQPSRPVELDFPPGDLA